MRPLAHLLGRRDVLLFQFLLDLPQGTAAEVSPIDATDDIRLLWHDFWLAVRPFPVSQHLLVLEGDLSRLRALLLPPGDILAEGFRLRLGKAAEEGDKELTGFRKGIDVLLFEVHPDAVGFQQTYCL